MSGGRGVVSHVELSGSGESDPRGKKKRRKVRKNLDTLKSSITMVVVGLFLSCLFSQSFDSSHVELGFKVRHG